MGGLDERRSSGKGATRLSRYAVPALVALLAVALALTPPVQAETSSQARAQIGQAYAAVLGAEQSGGNVTSLVAQLNSAILLVQQADLVNASDPTRAQALYSQASALATQVMQASPGVASAGRAAVGAAQFDLALETAILAALGVLAYVYTPRLFWGFWLRTHRGWRVRKR